MKCDTANSSLVIGGTGMLAKATRRLAFNSTVTLVVARRASHFTHDDASILPLDADWDSHAFRDLLTNAVQTIQPIRRALLWLHRPEPVLPWLLPLLNSAKIVLVLGSIDSRPELAPTYFQVATVRLGSMATDHGRRWLTDDEISNGAIAALTDGNSRIVGEPSGI